MLHRLGHGDAGEPADNAGITGARLHGSDSGAHGQYHFLLDCGAISAAPRIMSRLGHVLVQGAAFGASHDRPSAQASVAGTWHF